MYILTVIALRPIYFRQFLTMLDTFIYNIVQFFHKICTLYIYFHIYIKYYTLFINIFIFQIGFVNLFIMLVLISLII